MLLSEKELILNSLEQGMVAIDLEGQILMINETAIKLLGNHQVEIGNNLRDYSNSLNCFLQNVIETKTNYVDEEKIINGNLKVLINTSFMMTPNNTIIGVVANIASYTHVRELAEQITDYEGLIDSLRAQQHEFRNKLHTVSGLIQLEAYEDALDYIDGLSIKNKELHDFMSINIKDQKVAGLLLAKYNRLSEMKINIEFEKDCYLSGFPENLNPEIFCSILGNLLDNSKDAISDIDNPVIKILVQSDNNHCLVKVSNNGPAIMDQYKSKIYEPYFTTKEDGNGLGLNIIANEIEALNGSIEFVNDQGVSWYVKIPK
jgi:two-component system CitB family sensor kinase